MCLIEIVGINIHRQRKAQHLCLKELARLSGVSARQIQRIEHFETNASFNTIAKIAKGLGVKTKMLFEDPIPQF